MQPPKQISHDIQATKLGLEVEANLEVTPTVGANLTIDLSAFAAAYQAKLAVDQARAAANAAADKANVVRPESKVAAPGDSDDEGVPLDDGNPLQLLPPAEAYDDDEVSAAAAGAGAGLQQVPGGPAITAGATTRILPMTVIFSAAGGAAAAAAAAPAVAAKPRLADLPLEIQALMPADWNKKMFLDDIISNPYNAITPLMYAIANDAKLALGLIQGGASVDGVKNPVYGMHTMTPLHFISDAKLGTQFHPCKTNDKERAEIATCLITKGADLTICIAGTTGGRALSLWDQYFHREPSSAVDIVLFQALYLRCTNLQLDQGKLRKFFEATRTDHYGETTSRFSPTQIQRLGAFGHKFSVQLQNPAQQTNHEALPSPAAGAAAGAGASAAAAAGAAAAEAIASEVTSSVKLKN